MDGFREYGAVCFLFGCVIGGAVVAFYKINSYRKGWDDGYVAATEEEKVATKE